MNRPLPTQIRSFVLVAALTGLAAPAPLAAGTFVENVSTPYGILNGIEYVRHTGRLVGTTSNGPYRVPYDIISPADSDHASGRVIVEPAHQSFPLAARHSFLGNAFLGSRGHAHALIGWSTLARSILVPGAADVFLSAPIVGGVQNDTGIIADFGHALRDDPAATQLVGDLESVYAYGYSRTAFFTFRLLNTPAGQGLFDFTLLQSPGGFPAGFPVPYSPPTGIGNVIVLEVEADLINSRGTAFAFRVDDELYPHYREYEVAGAPHIPDTAATRQVQRALANTTPLNQSPIIRALLDAGDAWVRDGVEPPPSRTIAVAPAGQVDPLYPARGFTGIARDENLNALGGIRLPDLELGRGRYVAVDFAINPVLGIPVVNFGTWQDLRCVATADGSERFSNHGDYVSGFVHVTNDLARDRVLLVADALDLVTGASQSEVGKPHDCP